MFATQSHIPRQESLPREIISSSGRRISRSLIMKWRRVSGKIARAAPNCHRVIGLVRSLSPNDCAWTPNRGTSSGKSSPARTTGKCALEMVRDWRKRLPSAQNSDLTIRNCQQRDQKKGALAAQRSGRALVRAIRRTICRAEASKCRCPGVNAPGGRLFQELAAPNQLPNGEMTRSQTLIKGKAKRSRVRTLEHTRRMSTRSLVRRKEGFRRLEQATLSTKHRGVE